jgi:hypothetical protein
MSARTGKSWFLPPDQNEFTAVMSGAANIGILRRLVRIQDNRPLDPVE